MAAQHCTATRKDGTPCTARALADRPYCWGHDPDLAAQRHEKSRLGGANKAAPRRLEKRTPPTLKPVLATLHAALAAIAAGRMDPRV